MNQNCSHHFFVSQIFVGRTFIYLASLWFFLSFHLNSALFSGMRGGIFMCTLARLNKRLKHLLFHTLLKQEVQFFDDNNPGERSTTCLLRYLGTAWICRVNNAKGSPNENINADLTFGKWSVMLKCNWPDKLASKKPHNLIKHWSCADLSGYWTLSFSLFHHPGRLSSRLHSDVDRMGRTVALNANAVVRSTVKTFLMLVVMLRLSWELTVLTCIEMPLLAVVQNKYSTLYKVGVKGRKNSQTFLYLFSMTGRKMFAAGKNQGY